MAAAVLFKAKLLGLTLKKKNRRYTVKTGNELLRRTSMCIRKSMWSTYTVPIEIKYAK